MKTIFLDRDGVINENAAIHDYIKSLKDFKFIDGVKEAVIDLRNSGFRLIIISNQAGINKGIVKIDDIKEIDKYIYKELDSTITDIFYCPHKPEEACNCRKPKSGLLLKAAEKYSLDLPSCYYIGDSKEDVEMAKSVGCKMIFVLSGRGSEQIKDNLNWSYQPDLIVNNLFEASKLIVGGKI